MRRWPGTRLGLIPARAGKTARRCRGFSSAAAHPRACGENVDADTMLLGLRGSSPRVRGKPGGGVTGGLRRGLIPARAGKTRRRSAPGPWSRAHPRACGENWAYRSARGRGRGSSPRVRGKRGPGPLRRGCGGLIPARAGKTWPCPPGPRDRGAHPRACGENAPAGAGAAGIAGSSPRVRGKQREAGEVPPVLGLIPARAGKTLVLT